MTIEQARAFRDAVMADVWTLDEMDSMPGFRTKHEREGYTIHITTRPDGIYSKDQAEVHIWGPDGLAIQTPDIYSWPTIVAGLRVCDQCQAKDVDTFQVAFANRVCANCRPSAVKKYEKPGWCD